MNGKSGEEVDMEEVEWEGTAMTMEDSEERKVLFAALDSFR